MAMGRPMNNVFRVLMPVALALTVCAGPARSQVTAVAGAGSRTCVQMVADIADLPNTRRAYVSWMQGYLSGRNAARESAGLGLIDLADYEAQWDWLTAWCEPQPNAIFAEAVAALFAARVEQAPGR
jgi:hypothetical protein